MQSMPSNVKILRVCLLAIAIGVCFSENNQKDLRTKVTNEDRIIQLGLQHKRIDPSKAMRLSWQPRVFLYRGFLSNEECDYLISRVHGKKSHTAWSNDSPKIDMSSIPANFNISLDADDEIIRRIQERISAWTFLPKENSSSLRILHFRSEDPKQNFNYFNDESAGQLDKPLLATIILYLSDVSQGGQIIFPNSDDKIMSECSSSSDTLRPHKGNAMIFFSLRLNGTPDTSSSHARCPVPQGDMWCATKLFYLKKVVAKRDPSQSQTDEGADCTDEDENCYRWAAMGECQRNPVFMIGSPDYYGTCRKSCHACQH